MKKRFAIKRRVGNKNFVFLALMTGLILILYFVYVSHFVMMQKFFGEKYKNIAINSFDFSVQKENPSCKVVIDGQVVYQIDSISESFYRNFKIKLNNGMHLIEISTIDNQFKLTDSIQVVKYPMTYSLMIEYHYNPPVDEYQRILIDQTYQQYIKGINFNEIQKSDIRYWITRKVNDEINDMPYYEPGIRHFAFRFEVDEDNYLLID